MIPAKKAIAASKSAVAIAAASDVSAGVFVDDAANGAADAADCAAADVIEAMLRRNRVAMTLTLPHAVSLRSCSVELALLLCDCVSLGTWYTSEALS